MHQMHQAGFAFPQELMVLDRQGDKQLNRQN
jgi:hypothetical protein